MERSQPSRREPVLNQYCEIQISKGSVLNSAFVTELGNYIADTHIDAWIYGHSHTNIDTIIGSTKIVCNQLGYVYYKEHLTNGFDPCKTIEI